MRYATFAPQDQTVFPVCLLVPRINTDAIKKAYVEPYGIDETQLLVVDLHQSEVKKKTPVAEMKAYITEELAEVLNDCQVEYLLVGDAEYFKTITKQTKAEKYLGYVMDTEYGSWKVIYVPNYETLFYDPERTANKIQQGIMALQDHVNGEYFDPGDGIIHFAQYPSTLEDISAWLEKLLEMDCPLTIDTENFSLKHHDAGIGTISFAWNRHEGIAFAVDYHSLNTTTAPYGECRRNEPVRALLKDFFLRLKQKAIYHNISYDVYILVYQLFMEDILDTAGLLDGMDVLLRNWDCTKLITYLATNSCAGNKLSLKDQSQEFAGNYAEDEIKDISRIPLKQLLKYNLVDSLSTWFTHEKNWPTLVEDDQEEVYRELFQPAVWDIIQMQLTGMPLDMERVREVTAIMEADEAQSIAEMRASPLIEKFTYKLNQEWVIEKNETLKVKRVTLADAKEEFNPNSAPQLQRLLFEEIGLPVLSRTDGGFPSTDGDTLRDLVNHTDDPNVLSLLSALSDYKSVNKLTTSFLPAMANAVQGPDGWHYLFGNFNLGGTLSGRLSSSKPNLQNLPSNGKSDKQKAYAKLIKSCFKAPPGWVFGGLDFDSLEDKISALTTKDPNKLKVYTDGYDGHSLRAHAYFGEQMPDIRLSEGRRAFKIEQGDETHYLLEGDQVTLPDGTTTSIELVA